MPTIRQVIESSKRCKAQLEQLGYIVPSNIGYEVSGRMTRCLGKFEINHATGERKIKINVHLPIESLDDTMIHELIHALYPRDGHGYEFHRVASKVNRAFGYSVSTYASQEESTALKSAMKEALGASAFVRIKCNKCGKIHEVSSRKKVATQWANYKCKCGGSLTKID